MERLLWRSSPLKLPMISEIRLRKRKGRLSRLSGRKPSSYYIIGFLSINNHSFLLGSSLRTATLSDYNIQKESILCLGSSYPQYILKTAARLDNDQETVGSKFFPLYDNILDYWFPPVNGYDICPYWMPDSTSDEDFIVTLVIEYKGRPFLLLEVNPPCDFRLDSGREGAINQFMELFDEVGPSNGHAERLYAISAIGERWRAGYVTKGNGSEGGHPVKGIAEVNSLKSAGPNCWNPDVTSDASWSALQKIVDTIKGYMV
ncbi:hypothetical protein EDB89DRAFT_222314 [Lactarius sanguifluus]|nr:hypothetical protein EDB89DRAFT_222314 [Lactarius sanguifluus]